ncbi:hypothetical protein Tco_0394195 [Tanacetum coccineum]
MGTPTQVCVWSCPNFSAPAGRPFRMSTPVFVDLESSPWLRSSKLRVPYTPEDPYEDIRQAYLDGTDTESKPLKDPIDTETPEIARMAMRVPPAMSSSLSTSMAEVAAMSESVFYSLDSDSVSEDAEDDGPTVEDEDPAAGDEGLAAAVDGPSTDDESYGLDDESHGIDDESYGLGVESDGLGLEEEEEAVLGGQQQAALVVGTTISAPLGLESERPERCRHLEHPSLLHGDRPREDGYHWSVTITATAKTKGFLTEPGAQV